MGLENILQQGKNILNKGTEIIGDAAETTKAAVGAAAGAVGEAAGAAAGAVGAAAGAVGEAAGAAAGAVGAAAGAAAGAVYDGGYYVVDKSIDLGEGVYNASGQFIQKIQQFGKEYGDSMNAPPKTLNEKDREYIQKIKDETALEKTTSLIGGLGEIVGSLGSFVKGQISGTDEYEAKEKNSLLTASMEKMKVIRESQFNIHKLEILKKVIKFKEQFIKEGKDEETAELLANNQLNDKEKILFEKEKKIYTEKVFPILDKLQKDIEIQSKDYADFIKSKGLATEEKIHQGSFGVFQEISNSNRLEIDALIGPNMFKTLSNFDEKIKKVTELFTELDKQRLSVLSETDKSKYDEVNGIYSERHAAMKKYYFNQLKNELELNKTLYKKSDEKEREQKAADKAFASLTEKEKRLVIGEKLFNSIQNTAINKGQIVKAFNKGDYGRVLLNTAETIMGGFATGWDFAEGITQDSITFDGRTINQDRVSKSIINADENFMNQMGTFLLYNPGDVGKLAGSIGISSKVYKGLNSLEKTLAASKVGGFVGKVGGTPTKFVFDTLSTAGKSIISGIPINTQIDQTMGEISTESQEGLNMLTDLFFDMGIVSIAGTAKITKHNLLNNYMWGENAIDRDNAVKSFTEILNGKTGNNFTEKQVKGMLRDHIVPLYQKTLTPEITKNIFTKGQIYDYTTTVLKRMNNESLTTLFTPEGIVANRINPFLSIKQDFENIDTLILKKETLEGKEKQLYNNAFEQKLISLSNWLDGKTIEVGVKLDNVPKNEKEIFRSKLKEIRDIKLKEKLDINVEDLKMEMMKLRNQYSKIDSNNYQEYIELTNSITGDTIRMKTTDLEKIVEIQERGNLQTMIREGYIEFDKKTFKDLESKGVKTNNIKKEGVYKFRDNALVFLADNRKMFVDQAEIYLKKLGVIDQKIDLEYVNGMQTHLDEVNKKNNVETKRKTTLNSEYSTLSVMLSYELKQMLTGKGIGGTGTSKGTVTKQFAELEKIGLTIDQDINFAMQELKKILGEGRVVKQYLGDTMRGIQNIMEEVGEKDSLFVLAYGTFGDTKKNGEKMYAKYLLPGKRLLKSPIGKYFKPQKVDNFTHYTNKFVETLREIFIHSKVDIDTKIIDFDKGLQYLDALESLDYYEGIVIKKKDGTMIIDDKVLEDIINDAYKIIGNNHNKQKVKNYIKDFLGFIIKDESLDNRILGIIIKNLTYKLNINYNLVTKLIDKGNLEQEMKFLRILLMSNPQMESLSRKDFGIDKGIYKKYMDYEKVKWDLKADYILEKLELSRKNLELSLKRLMMTSSVRENLKKELKDIENKITIIKKNKKEDFSKIYEWDVLEKSVYTAIDERLKEIITGKPQIKSIEDYKKNAIELSKKLSKLTQKDFDIIKNLANKAIGTGNKEVIQEGLKEIQIIENKIIETLDEGITQEVTQVQDLLGIGEEIFDIMVHPLRTIADVDKDLIVALEANSKSIGIYDKKFTMANNPLEAFINSGFKVINEDEGEVVENLLLDTLKDKFGFIDETPEKYSNIEIKEDNFFNIQKENYSIKELEIKIEKLLNEVIDVDNSEKIKLIENEIELLKNDKGDKQKFLLFNKDGVDFYTNEGQTKGIIKIRNFLNDDTKKDPFVLMGPGGTGKTAVIGKAIESIDEDRIIFLGPTHKALEVLETSNKKSGINFDSKKYKTIDSFINNVLKFFDGKKITKKVEKENEKNITDSIIIIDEASMLGNKGSKEEKGKFDLLLAKLANGKNKIIFMGDPLQNPPVGEKTSPVFNNGYEGHALTETMRQNGDSPIVAITNKYRENLLSTNRILNPVGNSLRKEAKLIKGKIIFDDKKNGNVAFTNTENGLAWLLEKIKLNVDEGKDILYRYISFRNPYKMAKDPNNFIREGIFKKEKNEIIEEGELLMSYSPIIIKEEGADGNEKLIKYYDTSEDFRVKKYIGKKTIALSGNGLDTIKDFDIKISKGLFRELKNTSRFLKEDGMYMQVIDDLFDLYEKKYNKSANDNYNIVFNVAEYLNPNLMEDLYDIYLKNTPAKKSEFNIDLHTVEDSDGKIFSVTFKKDIVDLEYKLRGVKEGPLRNTDRWFKLPQESRWILENLSMMNQVHYGYGITVHRSQGSTYKGVVVDENDILQSGGQSIEDINKFLYVATSRPTNDLVIIGSTKVSNNIDSHVFDKQGKMWDVKIEDIDISINGDNTLLIKEKKDLIENLKIEKKKINNDKKISKLEKKILDIKQKEKQLEQTKQIKDIYDLYAKNKEFKEFIDSMYYTTDDISTQAWSKDKGIYAASYKNIGYKNFKELLGNLLDTKFGKKIIAKENGELKNIYEELKKDILGKKLKQIYGKFKRIGQKDFIKNSDGTDILAFSLIKDSEGKNILVKKESYFGDNILITKELNKKLPGIGYIKVNDIKDILKIKLYSYVNIKGETVDVTIDTLLNSAVAKTNFKGVKKDLKRDGDEFYNQNFDSVTKADVLFKILAGIKVKDLGFTGTGISSLNELATKENIKIIRDQLGLKDTEEIIGTFGDKDILIKKFDFAQVNKQYLDFGEKQVYITDVYLKALGYVDDKGKQLAADKATKRESAGMSNYSTFDKVDLPVNTFVLEEVHDGVDDLYIKINDEKNPFNIKEVLEEIENLEIYKSNTDLLKDFKGGLEGLDENGERSYIINNIGKDFNDGTSFVNESLHDLRNIINGLGDNKLAFKDHLTGILENGERFLGKTLFNRTKGVLWHTAKKQDGVWKGTSIMNDKHQEALNVFVGKSSHKLKGGYKKYDETKEFADKPKFVEINGRMYKIIGEVEGTTTQNFRNASVDSFEEKDLQSVALQILNGLPVNIQDELFLVIKKEIDVLYETHINDKLINRKFDIEGFKKKSEYEILDIVSKYKEEGFEDFGFTDSVLGSYLNKFLNSVDILINKGGTLGEPSYMQEASLYLKRNEIIISKDNEMYSILKKGLEDLIKLEQDPILKKQLEKKLKTEDFEIIGYRYPAVTKYNLGVYKVRIAENLENDLKNLRKENKIIETLDEGIKDNEQRLEELHKRFSNINKGNVVMSPYAVFIKKEGDFDGDHLYMISPYSDKGRLIAQGALTGDTLKIGTEYLDIIKDPKNRHITTSQVDDIVPKQESDKIDTLVENAEKKILTIYGTGIIALTAKKSVGLVAAGVRTIRIFKNMYDKIATLKNELKKEEENFFNAELIKDETVKKEAKKQINILISNIKNYSKTVIYRKKNLKGEEDIITIKDIIELFDDNKTLKFSEKGFDILSADLIQMAVDFAKSGKDKFPTDWVKNLFESVGLNYDDVSIEKYSQISTTYKENNKISAGDIWLINNHNSNIQKNKERLLSGMIGIKRDLYNYVLNKYGAHLNQFNNYNGLIFFNKQMENININIFNKINELDKNKIGYLNNEKILKLKIFIDNSNITNDFIEKYKTLDNIKTHQKIDAIISKFPNLFDIENKNNRYLLAIYAFANGDNIIYDLLTVSDKLDFIKMSSELNLINFSNKSYIKDISKKVSKFNETVKNKINEPIEDSKIIIQENKANEPIEDSKIIIQENKANEPIEDSKIIIQENKANIEDKTEKDFFVEKKEELIEAKKSTPFNNEKSSLEKQIAEIEIEIENLEKTKELNKINNQEIKEAIKELKKDYLIDYNNEYIPYITYEDNQTRDTLLNSINQANSYIVNKNKYLKFMMSDILEKYDGDFLDRYNMISSNVNELGGIELMIEFQKIEARLKKEGKKEIGLSYEEVDDLRKNIDEIIISQINWNAGSNSIEITVDEIIELLSNKYQNKTTLEVKDFSNSTNFKNELQLYIDTIAKPLLEIGNQLEKISTGAIGEISLSKGYSGKGVDTLFKDIGEASKSDGTLAYRTLGLLKKKDLKDRFISKGMSETHARQLVGLIVPKIGNVEKVVGILNIFHYLTNYGILGLVKGHISGLSQFIPNAVQIRAMINKYGAELDEADLFIKKNRLTGNEDMLRLSVAYDTETANHTIMQGISKMIIATSDFLTKWTGKDFKKYGKYIEAALMNPLSFWDMPLEGIRKRAAVVYFANTIGLKTIKELDNRYYKMLSSGASEYDIKAFIESGIRKHYANSGGGVISSSQIYRKTVLNTFNFDGKEGMQWRLPRTVVTLVGYLNGWGVNLASQYIDNQLKSLYSVGHLVRGNFKTSKIYLMDWLSYNKSIINMSLNAVGLYMKAQKYETDKDDMPDKQEFIKSFNNTLVSLEIIFGQLSGRSEIANRMGGNFEQVIGYTTTGLLERYLRSVIYPGKIIGNMYDEYATTLDSENKLGIIGNFTKGLEIFSKALTYNTDSFLRFNGIKAMNDQYDTITDRSNVAIFGLGGDTAEDEIFNYQFNSQNFIYYQKDGFWGSLYNIFANPLGRGERGLTSTTYDRVNEIIELLEGREGVSLIVNNKGIGTDGYDISRILGKELKLTVDNQLATDNLWDHMVFKYSDELDSKGRTLYKYGDIDTKDEYKAGLKTSKIDDIVTTVLRAELEKEGLNLDNILSAKTDDGKGFLKLMALAEKAEGISASQVMGYVLNNKYYEKLKEFQKANLKRGKNGVYHQETYDELVIKQSLLKEYQKYMNLDAMTVGKVLELEVKYNNKDIYKIFDTDNNKSNELNSRNKKIIYELNRQLALNYISTKELQKGNTFVEGLTSRYSTLLSGVDGTPEQIAKMTNRILVEIDNSAQEPKVKLAKQAALILGMNKASYGLIQDDEKFNKLSLESKKLITNWIYDTSIKGLDYDPKTMIKDVLNSSYKKGEGYDKKYYPNRLLNDGKKGDFGGGRPGFSKQFEPMQKLIQNKLPYISHDPSGYLGQINSIPRNHINILKIPIVKEYNKIKIEILMNEIYSKGIIKAGGKENIIAKQHKKNIILKPKRKIKTFKKKFTPQGTKTSKGLLPDKPFNYE